MSRLFARVDDDLDVFTRTCVVFQLDLRFERVVGRLALIDTVPSRGWRLPDVGWPLERIVEWTAIDSWETPKVYYRLWIGDAWRTHVTLEEARAELLLERTRGAAVDAPLLLGTVPAMEDAMSKHENRARALVKTVRKQAGDGWKFLTPELREALVMAAAARLIQAQELEQYAPAVGLIEAVEAAMTASGVVEEKNV